MTIWLIASATRKCNSVTDQLCYNLHRYNTVEYHPWEGCNHEAILLAGESKEGSVDR
jgi:hypothetical protein